MDKITHMCDWCKFLLCHSYNDANDPYCIYLLIFLLLFALAEYSSIWVFCLLSLLSLPLLISSEVEQSLAISISDRATDEVIEALTRCRRGLDISDSQMVSFDNAETPDIVRSRSSQDSMGFVQIRELDLPHRNLDSPTVSAPNLIHSMRVTC